MSPGFPSVPPPGAFAAPVAACDPPFPSTPPDRLATALAGVGTGTGNRCGHVPSAPRFFTPPDNHAPHPRILVRLQEAIETYFSNPDCLPSLNAANGSARSQRSERREACLSLLGALIHYLDLVTLRVGLPQDDGTLRGLSMPFLAERAGLGLRRAERACRDLVRAGLLKIHPRVEATAEGGHQGFPAIRRIPAALFKVFGLDAWLQRERDKAAQRRRRRQRRQETTRTAADAGRRELALEAARQRSATPPTPASPTVTESDRRQQARTILGAVLDQLRGRPPTS